MATFPDIAPDYGISKQSAPVVRKVQFGDGYETRLRYGLNQDPKTWPLTWSNITDAEALRIEAFLEARADDGASFDWAAPDTQLAYKWVCEQWDKTMVAYNRNTITATFRQVFEP